MKVFTLRRLILIFNFLNGIVLTLSFCVGQIYEMISQICLILKVLSCLVPDLIDSFYNFVRVLRHSNNHLRDYLSLSCGLNSLKLNVFPHCEVKHAHVWPILVSCRINLGLVINHGIFDGFSVKHYEIVAKINLDLWNDENCKHNHDVIKSNVISYSWVSHHQISKRGN